VMVLCDAFAFAALMCKFKLRDAGEHQKFEVAAEILATP
jgi:hypothetical protein